MADGNIVSSVFVVFAGAAVLATAALFARQAMIVAYILVGALAGPSGFALVEEILASGLRNYLYELQRQCAQIHSLIHQFYIAYPVEFALES